jgi:hypothetical protein
MKIYRILIMTYTFVPLIRFCAGWRLSLTISGLSHGHRNRG